MSATKFTASGTVANSSGRRVRNRKTGRSATLRTTYRSRRSVSSSAHWTSSMRRAIGRIVGELRDRDAGEVERAQQLGVRREALEARLVATGDRVDDAADGRLGAGAHGRLAERAVANRLRATRNGPRISSSAVIGDGREAGSPAISAAATSRRVLPMPGSPSSVTAASRVCRLADLLRDRGELGAPADDRAGRAAELDGQRALRLDERIEHTPVHPPRWRASLNGRRVAQHAADYRRRGAQPRRSRLTSQRGAGRRTSRATGPPWPAAPSARACTPRRTGRRTPPRPAAAPP